MAVPIRTPPPNRETAAVASSSHCERSDRNTSPPRSASALSAPVPPRPTAGAAPTGGFRPSGRSPKRVHYLVATASVHTTAAACDYLESRLDGPAADTVTLLTVTAADGRDADDAVGRNADDAVTRNADDAANVARARLAGRATVETATRRGDPAASVLGAVGDLGADVLVLGRHAGEPETTAGLGSTARAVLADATVPAVVVPLDALDPDPA